MSFNDVQMRQLKVPVRRVHVKERQTDGKTLHYLEGWWVVSEANRIFGFDAWERETVSSECVWRSPVGERFGAAYLTRVRISVRAGDRMIVREGLDAGEAVASTPGQAHERASKAAETDATKRALSTFGSRFGLSLYGERGDAAKIPSERAAMNRAAARVIKTVDDRVHLEKSQEPNNPHEENREPDEAAEDATRLQSIQTRDKWRGTRGAHHFTSDPVQLRTKVNLETVDAGSLHELRHPDAFNEAMAPVGLGDRAQAACGAADPEPLTAAAPGPSTAEGERREVVLLPVHLPPRAVSQPQRIDKSVLALPEPRRLRDRHHLKFVARQPCLVCGRTPSQAHHLRIAQPRALGRKVSDEFTVPLCALHHHDLHMKGNEQEWWSGHHIDPLPTAGDLWAQMRRGEA